MKGEVLLVRLQVFYFRNQLEDGDLLKGRMNRGFGSRFVQRVVISWSLLWKFQLGFILVREVGS